MYLILHICWLFSKVWFRCFSRHSKFFSVSLDFCPILRCLCSAFNLTEGKQFSQLLLHSCQFWYQRGLGVAVLWGMTPTISKWWQGKFRNAERSKDILAVFPLAKIRNQSAGISEMSASCYNQNTFFFPFAYAENQILNLKWNLEELLYSSVGHHVISDKAYKSEEMFYARM